MYIVGEIKGDFKKVYRGRLGTEFGLLIEYRLLHLYETSIGI